MSALSTLNFFTPRLVETALHNNITDATETIIFTELLPVGTYLLSWTFAVNTTDAGNINIVILKGAVPYWATQIFGTPSVCACSSIVIVSNGIDETNIGVLTNTDNNSDSNITAGFVQYVQI